MAREEKDILYPREFPPEEEISAVVVEEDVEEGLENHLGYHNFYGY